MKATAIVDGVQRKSGETVEVVHLNLLGSGGREIAAAYGIKIVPATVVVDQQGEIHYRRNGFPEANELQRLVVG